MAGIPRTDFAQAVAAISTQSGLDSDVILSAIKEAIVAAYRRDLRERDEELADNEELEYDVELDPVSGGVKVFLIEGKERKDVTPPGFGRIAAQTAKQVIRQKIREAEKGVVMEEFEGRVGSLISGNVLRFDGPNVRVDIGKTEGLMPSEERVPSERLNSGQRLTFLIKEIVDTPRGKQIILSRADGDFVAKLFAREVPEISSNSVEIKGVAREAGVRTKIAVFSDRPGVDPVGSCVGQKGVRVQAVTNELGGERVDIVPWSGDLEEYIKAALSPADVVDIKIDKKKKEAKVFVSEEDLSVAIGREGQNARLAGELTGVKIEVEEKKGKKGKKEKKEESSKTKSKSKSEKKSDAKKEPKEADNKK